MKNFGNVLKTMIHYLIRFSICTVLTLGAARWTFAADAPSSTGTEQELIGILKSGAPPAEKALACKRLAISGGKDAPAVLAPFLADEQLASWARIGIEANPDPSAGVVLREAATKLQGKLLIGVINSLGVRRDAKAVELLAGKLGEGDADVAAAAAAALGRICGESAVKALEPRLVSGPDTVRSTVAEGCILCAEDFLACGKAEDAVRLYDAVRNAKVNLQRTVEATRGAILARGAAGVPLLVEQLRSNERAFLNIGLRTARELPGPEVARALVAGMEQTANAERKLGFLLALADRGDAEALPAALVAAKSGDPVQRVTAIGLLQRLGGSSSVAPLLEIAAEDDPAVSQTAKSALTGLPGAEVDAAIEATLKQPAEKARILGIELAAQRRLVRLMPELLKSAEDPSAALRGASLKAIGELGGEAELQPLIGLLVKSAETAGIESALTAIGLRLKQPATGAVVIQKAVYGDLPDGKMADVTAKVADLVKSSASVKASNAIFGDPAGGVVKKLRVDYTIEGAPGSQTVAENQTVTFAVTAVSPAFVNAVSGAMAQASAGAKPALLRVLGSAGGLQALAAVRAALNGADPGMREAAFSSLCQWPDGDALPELKGLVMNGSETKTKVLAMRGYMRVVAQAGLPVERQLDALKDAMSFAPRDDERKLVLGALGGIRSPQAVKLILPHLENPALKEEACAAAVSVAENFKRNVPASVAAAMEKVAQTTSNPDLARRAKALTARK